MCSSDLFYTIGNGDPTTNNAIVNGGSKPQLMPYFLAWADWKPVPTPLNFTNFYSGKYSGQGMMLNSIIGESIVPSVVVTNPYLFYANSVSAIGDSLTVGYNTNPTTNYVDMVWSYVANVVETKAGLQKGTESNQAQSGYTANYFSTNGSYVSGKIGIFWIGFNDFRWQQVIGGLTPLQLAINANSNLVQKSFGQGLKQAIIITVPEWCNATNYSAFTGVTNSLGQQTNAASWSASIVLTNSNPLTFPQSASQIYQDRKSTRLNSSH